MITCTHEKFVSSRSATSFVFDRSLDCCGLKADRGSCQDEDLFTTAPEYAGNYKQFAEFHSSGSVASAASSACLPCPEDCLDCLAEVPIVKAGFALSDARRTSSDHATACDINLPGGKSVAANCVSLLRCRPDVVQVDGASYQCNGGEFIVGTHTAMSCADGYEGQLCGTCSDDFGESLSRVAALLP